MKKLLLLALMVVGCGKNPVGPSDTPTPVPTPVPVASSFTIKNGVSNGLSYITIDGAAPVYTCLAGVYNSGAAATYASVTLPAMTGTHSIYLKFSNPMGNLSWAFDTSPPAIQTTVSLTVNASGSSGIQLDFDGVSIPVTGGAMQGVAYTIY